jgi:hypothetical protein
MARFLLCTDVAARRKDEVVRSDLVCRGIFAETSDICVFASILLSSPCVVGAVNFAGIIL